MSLQRSCRLYGVSPQSIYQLEQRAKRRTIELQPVIDKVLDIRRALPRLGARKLYHLMQPWLNNVGIKLGRDGLFDLLRKHRLLIKPKRSYTKTTFSKHWMRKHPNLYANLTVDRPNQAWVSDITYVESEQGIHYLSLVTDAYSRKIVGYALTDEMKASDVSQALTMAIKQKAATQDCIHHSDRGLQYCSEHYQQILRTHKISPSMTDGYDCYQNALAERINGILKQEFLVHKYKTKEVLNQVIDEAVYAYNHLRPHLSLGMKVPEEVHKKAS